MYHKTAFGLLALGAAVHGFQGTSPFFMYSTAELLGSDSQFSSSKALSEDVSSQLSSCPSTYYVFVSQPEVSAADFATRSAAPQMEKKMTGKDTHVRSSLRVTEVVGSLEIDAMVKSLTAKCGTKTIEVDGSSGQFSVIDTKEPTALVVEFSAPPAKASLRQDKIYENDLFLASVLEHLPTQDYTVIYTTSARSSVDGPVSSPPVYDMEDETVLGGQQQQNIHMEMKRDYQSHTRRAASDNLPLFERYQYFTPGIFMGLGVTLLLSLILYTAVSGVSSLQVSYAAFDKENGPAAQKKAQ